jgi:hypothetical protein
MDSEFVSLRGHSLGLPREIFLLAPVCLCVLLKDKDDLFSVAVAPDDAVLERWTQTFCSQRARGDEMEA